MKPGRRRSLSLVVLGLPLLVGAWGPEVFAEGEPRGRVLKGRLIVKYNESLTESASSLFADGTRFQTATSDHSDSLDRLHERFGVTGAVPVFRSEQDEQALRQQLGRRPTLEDLRAHHRAKWQQARARKPDRPGIPAGPPVDVSHTYILKLDESLDVEAVASAYAQDPHVAYAHPDRPVTIQALPNDTHVDPDQNGTWAAGAFSQPYEDLWGLKRIQADAAWNLPLADQGQGKVVAVIDTGVDTGHPDVDANMVAGYDFSTCADFDATGTVCLQPKVRDAVPEDQHGHGTHVAGIIAAEGNNTQGVIGVAQKAQIMPLKALGDPEGMGLMSDVVAAIDYAASQNADVINLSLGQCQTPLPDLPPLSDPTLTTAVNNAVALGVVVVAAAGNEGIDVRHCIPANLPNVITVGASNTNDEKTNFSNFGLELDVVAPGGDVDENFPYIHNILSTRSRQIIAASPLHQNQPEGSALRIGTTDYLRLAGTSQAAPQVAGLAALVVDAHPTWSPQDVRTAIRLGADDAEATGFDTRTGYGRINVPLTLAENKRVILTAYVSSHTFAADKTNPKDITGTVTIAITNEWDTAQNVQGTLSLSPTSPTSGTVQTGALAFGTLNPGQTIQASYSAQLSKPLPGAIARFLVALSGTNFSSIQIPLEVQVKLSTLSTWPVYTSGSIASSPVLVDLDPGSPGLELVVGSMNGLVYVLRPDGSSLPGSLLCGWPQIAVGVSGFSRGVWSSPAVGDVDGNGDLEVVVGTMDWDDATATSFGNVYVWHHDGCLASGWPKQLPSQIMSTPALANLDGDAALEIVIVAQNGTVAVYNHDGSALSGWPKASGGPLPTSARPSAAIAQLDGTGTPEILVASTDERVYAWHANGTAVSGWPQMATGVIEASPAVADLDGDGQNEVVSGTGNECENVPPIKSGSLHVWRANGSQYMLPRSLTGCVRASPAIGSIDADPQREIVVALYNGTVHAYNHDGSLLWSKNAFNKTQGYLWSSPTLTDLDGNGIADVILGTMEGFIYMFRGDTGDLLQTPLDLRNYQPTDRGIYSIRSSVASGDFDNDSKVEVVLGADDGGIYRWDLTAPAAGSHPWAMFRQNAKRTGWLPPVQNVEVFGYTKCQHLQTGITTNIGGATVSVQGPPPSIPVLCNTTSDPTGRYACQVPPLSTPPGYSYAYFIRANSSSCGSSSTTGSTYIPGIAPNSPPTQADVTILGCFIATAAYGSALAPELDVLRSFRDERLSRSWLGRRFTETYYTLSPPVARLIADKPLVRALVRGLLRPVITYCQTKLEAPRGAR